VSFRALSWTPGPRASAALALFAGALAALAHPPFGLLPGLLGYGLWLWLLDVPAGRRPLRAAFWTGWLAAFAYFLIGCWWVAEAFMVDARGQGWMAPFAAALLPAGLGLFWGAASVLYRRFAPAGAWRVLYFAGCVAGFEWLRGHVLTGFPWNLPGETWKAGSAPSQMASLVGAYGLTWITLALAVSPVAILFARNRRERWVVAGLAVAALAGLYGFGLARLSVRPAPDRAAPMVRVVQADVRQEAKYDEANYHDIVARYVRLTAQPSARRPDIVVWPEGALPDAANAVLAPGSWTETAISRALAPGQSLMMGTYRVAQGRGRLIYFNSLVALRRESAGLHVTGVYDKHRLVPFGEYLPAERLLTPLGFKDLTHIGDSFSPGPRPTPMAATGIPRVQPLICYESLFPGLAADGPGGRPRWIVNVSNDAWFGVTSGPWQHLNLASYRAIEQGLPIVRATPTGVSAIIDAQGRAPASLTLASSRMGVIDALLPPAAKPTFYSRSGELIFLILLILSVSDWPHYLGSVLRRMSVTRATD
jgi:apolipoprotein N-acyltransferase